MLVFSSGFSGKVYVNTTKKTASNGIVEMSIDEGKYVIKKGDSTNLYYIAFIADGDNGGVSAPVFSLPSGEVSLGTTITLSCNTDEAEIYYTMTKDGNEPADPTAESTKGASISLGNTEGTVVKIKAIAILDAENVSSVVSRTYTLVDPDKFVAQPEASTEGQVAKGTSITLTCDTDGASIYYTKSTNGTDPADPTVSNTLYKASDPIVINENTIIKAIAIKGSNSSSIAKFIYTISTGNTPSTENKKYEFNPQKIGFTLNDEETDSSGKTKKFHKLPAESTYGTDNYFTINNGTEGKARIGETSTKLSDGNLSGITDYTLRYQFGAAAASPTAPGTIQFTTAGKAKVTVCAYLTNDKVRSLYLDADDNKVTPVQSPAKEYTFKEVEKGSHAIYAKDGDISILYVIVEDNVESGGSGDNGDDDDPTAKIWKVELDKTEYTYTGTAIKPGVTVYDHQGGKLVEGVDYTVKYSNNLKASVVKKNDKYTDIDTSGKKKPTVTVSGKGILSGKYTENFVIKPKDISNENDKELQTAEIRIEKGKKASTPVICYNGMKLGAKDYKYTKPDDKTTPFQTDGTIEIEGQGNYEGTRLITVKVFENKTALKAAAKKFKVAVENTPALVYSGDNLRDNIISHIKLTPALPEGSYAVTLPDVVKDAGTVKFMVVGLGDYSGCSVSKSIKVQPMALDEAKVDITGVPSAGVSYSNTGAVLSELSIKVKGKTEPLVNGRDYKLSYSSNKKAGNASYTITFKGNYKGKIAKKTFKINKAPLDKTNAKVELPDKVCKENANCKSTPYVTVNGVMVKASEYEVQYYVGSESATPTNKPKVTTFTDGKATVYVKIKAKANSKNYEVAGTGNEIKGSYTVWKKGSSDKDLSKAKVTFHNQADCKDKKVTKFEYSGIEVKPGGINVSIGKNGANLYNPNAANSNVTVTYVNNVNKGKATVIIKPAEGSGLIGSKVVTFNIVSKNASGLSKSVLDTLSDTFNIGDAIKDIFK